MEIKKFNNTRLLSLSSITTISTHTINPYKGCSFACAYCYASLNKNTKKYGKWGSFVIIKKNINNILENEIKQLLKDPDFKNNNINYNITNTPEKINPDSFKNNYNNNSHYNFRVIIGSNTDPYQPVELKYRSTYKIISILNKYNIGIFLMTKSPLVEKDIDLLKSNKNLEVCFTINSSNIINNLEKSFSLDERVSSVYKIFKEGINIYFHIGPYIPYFTDLLEIKTLINKYFSKIKFINSYNKNNNIKTNINNNYINKILNNKNGNNKNNYKIDNNYINNYNKNIKNNYNTINSNNKQNNKGNNNKNNNNKNNNIKINTNNKNLEKRIKINIEPVNLINGNKEFLNILKKLDNNSYNKLMDIYSSDKKYDNYYKNLQIEASEIFNFPYIKRVKVLKRERISYYSQDNNVQK